MIKKILHKYILTSTKAGGVQKRQVGLSDLCTCARPPRAARAKSQGRREPRPAQSISCLSPSAPRNSHGIPRDVLKSCQLVKVGQHGQSERTITRRGLCDLQLLDGRRGPKHFWLDRKTNPVVKHASSIRVASQNTHLPRRPTCSRPPLRPSSSSASFQGWTTWKRPWPSWISWLSCPSWPSGLSCPSCPSWRGLLLLLRLLFVAAAAVAAAGIRCFTRCR